MKVKVNYKDFLWLINCANFLRASTGMVIRLDTEGFDGLRVKGIIHNKYIFVCKIPLLEESEGKEDIVILNGRNRDGVENIIGELKVLSTDDDDSLEIIVRPNTIDFMTLDAYSMKKPVVGLFIQEDVDFDKLDWSDREKYHFEDIDVSVLKKTLNAYNKFHKLLPGTKVKFQMKSGKPSLTVIDAMASKKFAFPFQNDYEGDMSDQDIEWNFSILFLKQYLSNVDKIDLNVDRNKVSIRGTKNDSNLNFQVEIHNEHRSN